MFKIYSKKNVLQVGKDCNSLFQKKKKKQKQKQKQTLKNFDWYSYPHRELSTDL